MVEATRGVPLRYVVFSFIFLCMLAALAMTVYIHHDIWWYDDLEHFLGGAVISMACLYLCGRNCSHNLACGAACVGTAAVLGNLWEHAWYFLYFSGDVETYLFDTHIDMMVNISGAFGAWLYWTRWRFGTRMVS